MAAYEDNGFDPGAYTLLQQQLITVRARLDRQIDQLIRLNRISDDLLYSAAEKSAVGDRFAEAIVDALDVAVSVVWIFAPYTVDEPVEMAAFGLQAPPDWIAHGAALADELQAQDTRRAVALPPGWFEDAGLVDAAVCVCTDRRGALSALLLASNTRSVAGMSQPTSDETLEIVKMISEKLTAHLAARHDLQMIDQQVDMLSASQERLALVLKGTNDGWWDWDLRTDSCFVSQRWREMLGADPTSPDTLRGLWLDRLNPHDRPDFEQRLNDLLKSSESGFQAEASLRRDDGHYLPVLVRATVTRTADGTPIRFTGTILDLTERIEQEHQVRQLAYFDPLTNLPNRRLLMESLGATLRANAVDGQIVVVIMLDLDRFKTLNDTHGHDAGDELLRATSERLRAVVPGVDSVSRLSGDEFVAILPRAGTTTSAALEEAHRIAARIQQALRKPFSISAGTIHHSASIGVALSAGDALTVEDLLKRADVAMYSAKSAGRNAIRVFRPEMLHRLEERSRFEARLRAGFAAAEMGLVYQPQVDAAGNLTGIEALLRWTPDDLQPVTPSQVIEAAEECGLIDDLGIWAFHRACEQASEWHCNADVRMAFNLSASEFLHPEFVTRVLSVLAATGVPGSAIRLEITEATVVSDLEFAASRMEVLAEHGIEFSLDDFGTGYSSLTYLRRLPLSEVKIDRSYVSHLPDDAQDVAIVQTILSLCSTLGLRVVAEGVENHRQLAALQEYGGEHFQGYLFGRPQSPPPTARELVHRPA